MSVREERQTKVGTERAARTRMEGQSRSSQKYLLLQVWCGLLTMSMVVMAAFVATIKSKSEETSGAAVKPKNLSSPAASAQFSPEGFIGMSPSYIQLGTTLDSNGWQENVACPSRSLSLRDNAIYVNSSSSASSFFFVYAQVVFRGKVSHGWSVALIRGASEFRKERIEAHVPVAATKEGGPFWMGKIIILTGGDSVTLNITGNYEKDETIWGAFQLG